MRRPWWDPAAHAERRPFLAGRAAIAEAIRRHFRGLGFIEVDTPALQVSPGLEPHLVAFATELREPFDTGAARRYLHTSPEYAMKKLLVAGETRVFQLGHVFRNEARSPTHQPEFTMLEWYRAGATWSEVAEDCLTLLRVAGDAVNASGMRWQGRTSDPRSAAEWLSVADAVQRHAGIDVLATLIADDPVDPTRLALAANRIGVRAQPRDTWEDVFFRIMLDCVEHRLGTPTPTILHSYPAALAALARIDASDARVAERFELYVCGLELANGFGELTDAVEQRRRFMRDLEAKERLGFDRYPVDEDFLAALDRGMPEAAGAAMGFDRLVMLATGAKTIDDVLWAPVA
ncbi:MAG: EF-P lysine aminoacylase GenX [Alphaproteobacteria bacterium]|nr:EF-P lysine aminoacylase GenX [Alphaproteobacteria bacterium]